MSKVIGRGGSQGEESRRSETGGTLFAKNDFPPLVDRPQGGRHQSVTSASSPARSERRGCADHRRCEQQPYSSDTVLIPNRVESLRGCHSPPPVLSERGRRGVTKEFMPPPDGAATFTHHLPPHTPPSPPSPTPLGPSHTQGDRRSVSVAGATVGTSERPGAEETLRVNYGPPPHPFSRQAFLSAPTRDPFPFYPPISHFQWPYHGPFPSPFMSHPQFSYHGHPFMAR